MNTINSTFPLGLLPEGSKLTSISSAVIDRTEQLIASAFSDKDVTFSEVSYVVGPTVVRFELTPDKAYKLNRIHSCEDKLNEVLSDYGPVRLIAPVSEKGTIAVEVPRPDRQIILLREVLESKEFQESKAELPIALGISTENKPIIADLYKMPHLLIGGATGMGKSVLLNSIIVSLLCRKNPEEVKFSLIDTKMAEFEHYSKIKEQYLVKIEGIDEDVISSPEHVITALNSLWSEMDRRYEVLRKTSCRSNREYNQKVKEGKLLTADGYKIMPYIVVIIDEFADLIIAYGKAIECLLARLAQKGRAVGIYFIISTQQPSPQVLTGILKANFPARIAFKVHDIADSRTILDMPGAQLLLDKGDMLVSNNGIRSRVQGAFIDGPEIEKICVWIARNNSDSKLYVLPVESRQEADSLKDDIAHNSLFDESARMNVSSDIDNRIIWDNYFIYGKIDDIKKVARVHGIINIGVDDIISMLSTTNTNYVTLGIGIGPNRILTALNHAIDQLPVELQHVEKMIVNVWASEYKPVAMSEIKAMIKRLGYTLPEINLIWGVAYDPDMNEDIKITLIAVSKHKLC